MDKKILHNILSRPFDLSDWRSLLTEVFGVKNFLQRPANIPLANSRKAEAAFELGSFNTADDRIIGLYLVKVKPEVWLERNKVGLRELLRSVYKYDVDGALIVFEQGQKWRLSFVSEIKVLNDEGEVIKQASEPRRYTYLLGEDEKVRTPVERLSKLMGKELYINDILNAFSVEALNEEFYKIVQAFFYQLVGGKVGKGGKTTDFGNGILQLPTTDRNVRQEFAVRLIGRTVFCWFLKMKKSNDGLALLPEALLSSSIVKQNRDYYRVILERLFFQTLNTQMNERLNNLPNGAEIVPFLNGGLFEPDVNDFYRPNKQTGLNDSRLNIADDWFLKFFEELEKYNFTIDENSVTEIEVSVDPEMLGRIFENLLAEIDPDSGETARKATGSFYTPREIVDYMATESLVQYLHNQTGIRQDKLFPIFKMLEIADPEFALEEKSAILDALDKIKILDPACGSGAFPIGVLQKIVQALQKLDPDAVMWKKRQIDRISNAIVKKQLKEKLESSGVEYARKIGIIQNSLYGVDIQPIAAEISKLRCFLSLIVDENIDETKSNRGIEPLPNLEFKFVTADTLMKLPETHGQVELNKRGKKSSAELEAELNDIRQEYIQSFGEDKKVLKQKLKDTQKQLFDQQGLFGEIENNRYHKISNWNPFEHDKSDWFDPKWMFGVEKFDVVIGNPPYVRLQGIQAVNPSFVSYARKTYKSASKGNWDLYVLFMERGYEMLSIGGILAFIQPHKFFQADFGTGIRGFITKEKALMKIVNFGAEQIFNSATNYTCLFFLEKRQREDFEVIDASSPDAWKKAARYKEGIKLSQPYGDGKWNFSSPTTQTLLDKLNKQPETLDDVTRKIFVGLQTSADNIYVLKILEEYNDTYKVYSKVLSEELEIEKGLVKPFLMGKDVKRYAEPRAQNVVIFPYKIADSKAQLMSQTFIEDNFPLGWKYILKNKSALAGREKGKMDNEQFYAYIYPKNLTEFEAIKIMTRDIANTCEFTVDFKYNYHTTTIYSFSFKDSVKESLYYWLGLLNSKIMWYFLQATGNIMRGGYYRFKTEYLKPFPVKRIDFSLKEEKEGHRSIVNLLLYILLVNKVETVVNPHVPNTHIAQLFEEVVDAIVMELYFKEDFVNAGIGFIKYAERDFEDIEGKTYEESIAIIQAAYQKLRGKDNEIRNNLKLMDIKLADIVMLIKTAR